MNLLTHIDLQLILTVILAGFAVSFLLGGIWAYLGAKSKAVSSRPSAHFTAYEGWE